MDTAGDASEIRLEAHRVRLALYPGKNWNRLGAYQIRLGAYLRGSTCVLLENENHSQ